MSKYVDLVLDFFSNLVTKSWFIPVAVVTGLVILLIIILIAGKKKEDENKELKKEEEDENPVIGKRLPYPLLDNKVVSAEFIVTSLGDELLVGDLIITLPIDMKPLPVQRFYTVEYERFSDSFVVNAQMEAGVVSFPWDWGNNKPSHLEHELRVQKITVLSS